MGEIESAFDKAMQRVEKLGKASPEELRRMEHAPEGNTMAAKYLRGDITDLSAELSKLDAEIRLFVTDGVLDTLLRNISLPRSAHAMQTASKAMEGILELKQDKAQVKEVFDQIEHLFEYYTGAVQQAFVRLKQEFEAKIGETKKALEQQMGAPVSLDVEQHPQFQEEWRRIITGLDAQYEAALAEHKQRLLSIL